MGDSHAIDRGGMWTPFGVVRLHFCPDRFASPKAAMDRGDEFRFVS
jgi:hypothetical protein